MKYYVIVVENGSYSDYSMTNLFLVETEQLAEQLVTSLRASFEYYWNFRNNELRQFAEEYRLRIPEPVRPVIQREPRYQPQAPGHLRNIPKKERKEMPEYKAFITALRAFEAESKRINDADYAIYDAWLQAERQWAQQYSEAEKKFLDENLWPMIHCSFPDKYKDLSQHVTGYDSKFSWNELELI